MSEEESLPVSQKLLDEKEEMEENLKNYTLPDEEFKDVLLVADQLSKLSKQIKKQVNKLKNPGKQEIKAPTILSVKFDDGTVFKEEHAVKTFTKAIQYMGLEKVSCLEDIQVLDHPLVSKTKNINAKAPKQVDGYYIETYSSTKQKQKWLKRIAEELNIGIEFEIMKK